MGAHGQHAAGEVGHDRFLAHHFEDQSQQLDAGKLGMWLFLVQEILFFSGLFCAYAIYRSNHPEIFAYADHFLDRKLGFINTLVLIVSSFTIAWAVRAAQMGQRRLCVALLGVTFACACGFLGIKTIEYRHKFHDGLLPGKHYHPTAEAIAEVPVAVPHKFVAEAEGVDEVHPAGPPTDEPMLAVPHNVHIFFGIYFGMTGLHGLHVLIGMGIIIWMMVRAGRGDFSASYFGPIEFTALYWHLVDLVWIYLFPLLYLIH